MKSLHVTISGRVQGVWFRASTREEALKLGVNGWVRNTPDGCVEVFMQGSEDAVDRLLAWCYHGPPGARVDDVQVKATSPRDDIDGFSIKY
ncbi:MAG: acylphosphatase [Deltaproteobacteria bacterium]|nr:acylphosphatase [Deltaproteobacteria bacterium]